ncbi:MAG: hypothetical protein C5B52_15130 [Bacteroidetes bacterium]|nr:MAG: hypothetical protein C5B52_15130 [Bacteroidota bacterium]
MPMLEKHWDFPKRAWIMHICLEISDGRFFADDHSNAKDMADDKKNKGKQDDLRVDFNDPSEVEYLHRQFPNKTHEEIRRAILKYGPLREEIVRQLKGA